jgi:hypothetical protein
MIGALQALAWAIPGYMVVARIIYGHYNLRLERDLWRRYLC